MKYTVQNIVQHFNSGERPEYVFFWDEFEFPGELTKACLSQWYRAPFEEGGVRYTTSEQHLMAAKARLFGGEDIAREIMASDDPAEYKALGRKVQSFIPEVWDEAKFDLCVKANLAKFAAVPKLKAWLLGTGDKVIVEASQDDTIWGVGLVEEDPYILDPNNWQGENLLGFALMEVRDILRAENAE